METFKNHPIMIFMITMTHYTKSGSFQVHEPFLPICTQLQVFKSALLQAVRIQEDGLQRGDTLWGRQKREDRKFS